MSGPISWTEHASRRATERGIGRGEVEAAIRDTRAPRRANRGAGDWQVEAPCARGGRLVVVFDDPTEGGADGSRVITVWRARERTGRRGRRP